MEIRRRVLKKYNLVNPYESIEIFDKEQRPVLEINKKEMVEEGESDEATGKTMEGKLDVVSQGLSEYNKKILEITEKYNNSFTKLLGILENPVAAGLNIE